MHSCAGPHLLALHALTMLSIHDRFPDVMLAFVTCAATLSCMHHQSTVPNRVGTRQ